MNKSLLSKEYIEDLKNNQNKLEHFLSENKLSNIVFVLEKFGRMENGNSKNALLKLLDHEHENIRCLAVKNLAKFGDEELLSIFFEKAKEDDSTSVRREATSAIGRLRSRSTIDKLISLLKDKDPKIIMQAIRGLMVFRNDLKIKKELQKLSRHPNEMIRDIIAREFSFNSLTYRQGKKHDDFPAYLRNKVVKGDVLKILQYVENESVHLTFTSPPYYNARDYSIYKSYEQYLNFLSNVFREVLRITKDGRFFVLNTSPIIIPRVSRAHSSRRYPIPYDIHPRLIDMGWEFIDDIIWVKPESSVKNRNASFLKHRKPLAYKPNCVTEMIMVYRKKTHRLIDWNIKQYSWNKIKFSKVQDGYETTNLWQIDPCFDKTHSAVFPKELCERVIKYYSFVDDLIFDPFAGSGTLGKAASRLKRYFFMTEKEEKYVKKIKYNLEQKIDLFNMTSLPQIETLTQFKRSMKS